MGGGDCKALAEGAERGLLAQPEPAFLILTFLGQM